MWAMVRVYIFLVQCSLQMLWRLLSVLCFVFFIFSPILRMVTFSPGYSSPVFRARVLPSRLPFPVRKADLATKGKDEPLIFHGQVGGKPAILHVEISVMRVTGA
jgi:hypothetical protein